MQAHIKYPHTIYKETQYIITKHLIYINISTNEHTHKTFSYTHTSFIQNKLYIHMLTKFLSLYTDINKRQMVTKIKEKKYYLLEM